MSSVEVRPPLGFRWSDRGSTEGRRVGDGERDPVFRSVSDPTLTLLWGWGPCTSTQGALGTLPEEVVSGTRPPGRLTVPFVA